jgi:D-alanyl-D-alanine carboxypeptidase
VAGCGGATPTAPSPAATASTAPQSAPGTIAAPSVVPTPDPITLLPSMPTNALDAATAARLQAVLDHLIADGNPDVLAAVMTPDGAWAGAAGVDGPNGRLAKATDEFNIASVSKLILATLVLKLDQDGAVALDEPLASYLGDLAVDANHASVRDALAMRAGIGDTPADAVEASKKDCARAWTRAETLPSIPAPSGSPGTFEYSNPTYKLLALAVEHATAKRLDRAIHDALFAPLGLDRMLVQTADSTTPKPWALPISGHEDALDLKDFGVGGSLPCRSVATFSFQNAVASDAPSLARWAWGLFEGKIVDRAHLTAMTTTADATWALGIERLSGFGELAYGTAGHQDGYNAFVAVLPASQVVVVAFINAANAEAELASHGLVAALNR